MSKIQFTATFPNIPPENLGTFKEIAAQQMVATRTEAGSLQYDWFFNDDETKCIVREAYVDSDAVLAHGANVGELLARLGEVGGAMDLEVFGNPSDDLTAMFAAMNAPVYKPFQSK
jgi:quinol monooxygenase YgiN